MRLVTNENDQQGEVGRTGSGDFGQSANFIFDGCFFRLFLRCPRCFRTNVKQVAGYVNMRNISDIAIIEIERLLVLPA